MTRDEWLFKCNHWKNKWPVMQPEYLDDSNGLNIYAVLEAIHEHSPDDAVIMCDAGTAYYVVPQAYKFKGTQRLVMSQSQGDMGWALPASIGVAKAGAKNVICIVGDGSFMSNMQELAVIREHNLPIKIVVLNNSCYLSIKNTQTKFFEGRVHGVNAHTGVWFPELSDVAATFDMTYVYVEDVVNLNKDFELLLSDDDSILFDCRCTSDQQILPSQAFKGGKQAPLHDMTPFLSDEELAAEMVKP
jgi:acetolactate synthase I/II/III large subunit